MTISTIIPVYGVERYLNQCVDSVLNQTYSDIEIILVDDGSQDGSAAICDEYSQKDQRVKVIHKPNGGLSDARNTGIQQATGEYVLFIDGDDFWKDHEALERVVNRLCTTQADVLNFSYMKFWEQDNRQESYFSDKPDMPKDYKTLDIQMQFLTDNSVYIASACNKAIRRSLLTEELLFEKGIFSEDIEWCARLMVKAKSMDFINENFYVYRQHAGSISHSITDRNCIDLCNSVIKCATMASHLNGSKKAALLHYTAFQLGTYVKNQAFTEDLPSECTKKLSQYSWLFRYYSKNKKLKLLYIVNRVIPFAQLCKCVRMVYHRGTRS